MVFNCFCPFFQALLDEKTSQIQWFIQLFFKIAYRSLFIFPSKDNQFLVLLNFNLSSKIQLAAKEEAQTLSCLLKACTSRQRSYERAPGPPTKDCREMILSSHQPLSELQDSALFLNVFYNQFQPQQHVRCLSVVLLNTQVAFLESCRLFAIGLHTISERRVDILKMNCCSRPAAGPASSRI